MTASYSVLEVIPHGEPMSLLDKIVSYDDNSLRAELTITENSQFYIDGAVPAYVGIEYMGQAIAAFAGVEALNQGSPISVGFLVGARKFASNCSSFTLGTTLHVRVERITEAVDGLSVFSCSIRGDDEAQSEIELLANLNVFAPTNVEEYFERSA